MRELVAVLEADLSMLIAEVLEACDAVREGVGSTVPTLEGIRARGAELAAGSQSAKDGALLLAAAAEEFAVSSEEIGRNVGEAGSLAEKASLAATDATRSVDELKSSTGEIGNVVDVIAAIARQTSLLALNATIEAARAGQAGRGFAVVASEVKALSVETQRATGDIARKIDSLQQAAADSIAAVHRITQVVATMRPVFEAVTHAASQQASTTHHLTETAEQSSQFIARVTDGATAIEQASGEAAALGIKIGHAGAKAADLAQKLKLGFVTFLRQSEIGNMRRHERLPCELNVTLHAPGGDVRSRTIDVSEGGMLVKATEALAMSAGQSFESTIEGIGRLRARVVNRSQLGLHCEFVDLSGDLHASLVARLKAIRDENAELINRVVGGAAQISRAMEQAVADGLISMDDLFDNEYEPIAGSDPQQFMTRSVKALERVLPPIIEPLFTADKRTSYFIPIDRNGFVPVHNRIYSQPQRPGDVQWNTANCRNRRIFSTRGWPVTARNVRPYLIQHNSRDMGNGVVEMIKGISAPIRVHGRHWGGLTSAYKL